KPTSLATSSDSTLGAAASASLTFLRWPSRSSSSSALWPGGTCATWRWKEPRSSSFSASIGWPPKAVRVSPGRRPASAAGGGRAPGVGDRAGRLRYTEVGRQLAVERLDRDAEPAAFDAARLQLAHHLERRVDRDGEADAAPLAARVDADHAPLEVDQRAA